MKCSLKNNKKKEILWTAVKNSSLVILTLFYLYLLYLYISLLIIKFLVFKSSRTCFFHRKIFIKYEFALRTFCCFISVCYLIYFNPFFSLRWLLPIYSIKDEGFCNYFDESIVLRTETLIFVTLKFLNLLSMGAPYKTWGVCMKQNLKNNFYGFNFYIKRRIIILTLRL